MTTMSRNDGGGGGPSSSDDASCGDGGGGSCVGDRDDDAGSLSSPPSLASEDSREPYYHVETGKICPAREAWAVLAAEGHPAYASRARGGGGGGGGRERGGGVGGEGDLVVPFRSRDDDDAMEPPPATPGDDPSSPSDDAPNIELCSSFADADALHPTQSSIDRALHPDSPDYISPNKDLTRKPSSASGSLHIDVPVLDSDSEAEAEDPEILRAQAMALAAANGRKLTPEQVQLIARPDVQQQKLIEEAKRTARSKEVLANPGGPGQNLQRIGEDFKKFVQSEKGKAPLQWGADFGKFIESQGLGLKMSHAAGVATGGAGSGGASGAEAESPTEEGAERGAGEGDQKSDPTPAASPRERKKMEGFGTDPSAPRPSPGSGGNRRASDAGDSGTSLSLSAAKGLWGGLSVPPLPLLNESIAGMLPGANKGAEGKGTSKEEKEEEVVLSGVLWKRRSGLGKHSAIKAWERRRVELRGTRLMYYKSAEEEEAEDTGKDKERDKDDGPVDTGKEGDALDAPSRPTSGAGDADASSAPRRPLGLLQAAERQLQSAREELGRLTGISSAEEDAPRGILDLVKERASISASAGHSSAPTPFCLSIRVGGETRWKFCLEGHGQLMEWLAALTDVVVGASVGASVREGGSMGDVSEEEEKWEVGDYCVRGRRGSRVEAQEGGGTDDAMLSTAAAATFAGTGAGPLSDAAAAVLGDEGAGWMICGTNLYVAWALANVALILARRSSTTIDQFWKLVVFANFGLWQLCRRRRSMSPLNRDGGDATGDAKPATQSTTTPARDVSFKPVAGSSTVKVEKAEDPNVNENGDYLPSWAPVSPSFLEVRSHGYKATKRKIPSPGELYECVAVDCLASDARFPNIAPRVRLPPCAQFEGEVSDKTWKSPDLFIVSISIPTEAPRLGQPMDDGQGLTIVGYFRMRDETREILRRVTSEGYDPGTEQDDPGSDVQESIVNGVRLWERYCREAPSDPSFQARFKLISHGNLEELGCPSYIAKYNAKPVLIKRNGVTGFFVDHPSLNVMEFDISLHPFPYLFKQAMAYLKDYFDSLVGTFGFVIEGRDDDELPEVVIGAMRACYAGPKFIVKGEEFFAGTCPRSTPTAKEGVGQSVDDPSSSAS
ncbi:hypothetical protein ACHAWF_018235 [Thalassiosira exigua]